MADKLIPWTFKSWVVRFQGVDLPIGDLAEDVAKDPAFPDVDDFELLKEHIEARSGLNRAAVAVFEEAWGYYLASAGPEGSLSQTIL